MRIVRAMSMLPWGHGVVSWRKLMKAQPISLRATHIRQLALAEDGAILTLSSSHGGVADLRSKLLAVRSAAANASCKRFCE